jgi:hypothetical protein
VSEPSSATRATLTRAGGIPLSEWKSYLASDPELVVEPLRGRNPRTGQVVEVPNPGLNARYADTVLMLRWHSDAIESDWDLGGDESELDEQTTAKIERVARALGATVTWHEP